jgi:Uma2 family endonuclease
VATATSISVNEYRNTIYRPDCEYVDGELLERNVGEFDHSRLQGLLYGYLLSHENEWGVLVVPEQRVQVKPSRFRVPDIAVLLQRPQTGIVTEPPLLCVEILSPGDRMAEMQERIDDYLAFGVHTVWVIDPATRRAHIYMRDRYIDVRNGILNVEGSPVSINLNELP